MKLEELELNSKYNGRPCVFSFSALEHTNALARDCHVFAPHGPAAYHAARRGRCSVTTLCTVRPGPHAGLLRKFGKRKEEKSQENGRLKKIIPSNNNMDIIQCHT